MLDAPKLLRLPKSECPDVWIRLPRHKWPKLGQTLKILWYLSNEMYMDSSAGVLWERQFEEIPLEFGWETVPNCECSFVRRKPGLFFSHVEESDEEC